MKNNQQKTRKVMEYSKIEEIKRRYRDYDKNNVKYAVSLKFQTATNPNWTELFSKSKGAEKVENSLHTLIEDYKATKILVEDFNGLSNTAKKKNEPVVINLRDTEKPETVPPPYQGVNLAGISEQEKNENRNLIEELANAKAQLYIKETEIMRRQEDIDRIRSEKNELANKIDTYEIELERYEEELERLSKYEPKRRFNVGGVDGISVLSDVFGNVITNFARRNPSQAKAVLGDELSGLVLGENNTSQQQAQPMSEEDKTKEEIAKNLYNYLKILPLETARTIYGIIEYLSAKQDNLDYVVTAIKENSASSTQAATAHEEELE